ncbi:GIY-YIG nuclease family protein [Marisediminicola antarctica]|uniref:ATPase n=1 Tax=Marisediminicola antarctica TaxID=674079 RepID=A0A7L5AGM5_9MICO|nr:GIY-YIG nuclease family protein [Marisediminicola antarctica]QHO69688.1 ATPase [Marisediminicola antarctica]
MSRTACAIASETGGACSAPVAPGAPLNLCTQHLLAAHDWVAREVGVTDTLPSPCLACGSRLGVKYPSGWLCAICEWKVGEILDDESSGIGARVDVVYYLRFRDRIKIGTSGNPRQRLAALRYDELLAFERGDRVLEQRRHAQFAAHRILRSEWFEVHDALVAHIRILRDGVEDPWSQHTLWLSQRLALGRSVSR